MGPQGPWPGTLCAAICARRWRDIAEQQFEHCVCHSAENLRMLLLVRSKPCHRSQSWAVHRFIIRYPSASARKYLGSGVVPSRPAESDQAHGSKLRVNNFDAKQRADT